jgi:hypothetical protein
VAGEDENARPDDVSYPERNQPEGTPPWIVSAWTSDSSASANNMAIGFFAQRSAMTMLPRLDRKMLPGISGSGIRPGRRVSSAVLIK